MSKHTAPPKSYESALAELEAIIARMESSQLPLEESLAAYQRGAGLLHYCQQSLLQAEQQVRLLNEAALLQPYHNADE